MKKYLVAGGLATILILGACEEGSTTEDAPEEEEATTEETTEEESAETSEEDASAEENEDTEDVVEEETEVTEENLSVGDTAEMEGVSVTIDAAYYTDERNEFAEIEADSVMMLDISFENNTGEDYSPAMDFEVYADGSKAEEYPVGDVILESVSDGRSGSGTIAFALVGEPSEIEVEFAPFLSFSGEKAIYSVTPE